VHVTWTVGQFAMALLSLVRAVCGEGAREGCWRFTRKVAEPLLRICYHESKGKAHCQCSGEQTSGELEAVLGKPTLVKRKP
jgi:hypothetical protein